MLLLAIADNIGTITLDRDHHRRNASAKRWSMDSPRRWNLPLGRVRCVVLRAKPGSTVWSAGHDIDEPPAPGSDPLAWRDPMRKLIREIELFPAPVIAMIEGSDIGAAPAKPCSPAT